MSSNNCLIISLKKNKFVIVDTCVDTGEGFEVGKEGTLAEAIEKAKKYMGENLVEYGMEFGDIKKKEKGE